MAMDLNAPPNAYANALPMRVMLVEAEGATLYGLRHYIASAPSFRLCVEAQTVVAAQVGWVQQQPEVAVIDPDLDGGGGWRLLRELTRAQPPVQCLVLLRQHRALG